MLAILQPCLARRLRPACRADHIVASFVTVHGHARLLPPPFTGSLDPATWRRLVIRFDFACAWVAWTDRTTATLHGRWIGGAATAKRSIHLQAAALGLNPRRRTPVYTTHRHPVASRHAPTILTTCVRLRSDKLRDHHVSPYHYM
jgi:hypothetical protein